MKPTMEILLKLSKNSLNNKDEIFTRLYRYLLRPDIYFAAYKKLYANSGAGTKGVTEDTADGFGEEKIRKIINSLADESYQPMPVRRTYIQKKNSSKQRPLGIPTFSDKLVQEALRMILEAVYEPIFLNVSHGFRPKHSCHTALKFIKMEFNGARWFVEGDIKGCFDNIDHQLLIELMRKKIRDARIIKLIYKFLKAGYMENWKYHKTYSGTPQGGIISPLLANIYLHELDKFVMELKDDFDKLSKDKITPEYREAHNEIKRISYRLKKLDGEEREKLLEEYRVKRRRLMSIPCTAQTDKRIKYVRYADDFLIAVKGSKEDCLEIKRRLAEFISNRLRMELSEEKTLVTHSSQCARFLGYDIRVRRSGTIKRGGNGHVKMRTMNGGIELLVPFNDKIHNFVFSKGIAIQADGGKMFPVHRKYLISSTDLETVMIYNSELRGICNYYSLASNFNKLDYFAYLMEYSCLKTLASRHKSSISKIKNKYRVGKDWGVPYETKKGRKICLFAKYKECKRSFNYSDTVSNAAIAYGYAVNTLENRLKAHTCELCGTTDSKFYEVHHVNKLKNLKGKEKWELAMIAKKRKTLIVCRSCHRSVIHKN